MKTVFTAFSALILSAVSAFAATPRATWVNIGSNSGMFAFDWAGAGVNGLNLAASPQSERRGAAKVKASRAAIADGATVIIPICPFSSVLPPSYDKRASSPANGLLSFDGRPPASSMEGFAKALDAGWKKEFSIRDYSDPMSAANRAAYVECVAHLRDFVSWCRKETLRPVIVLPPAADAMTALFPARFMENYVYGFVRDVTNGTDTVFLDYWRDGAFRDADLYATSLFLNRTGRRLFTSRVMSDLSGGDALWFCADFDHPAEIDGRRIDTPMRSGEKAPGRFGSGYAFLSRKDRCENEFLKLADPLLLKNFPSRDGSFACWFRSVDTNAPMGAAFSVGGFWQFRWGWNRNRFHVMRDARRALGFDRPLEPSARWRHFAATWNAGALVVYLDGETILRKENVDLSPLDIVPGDVVRFGAGCEGRGNVACGFVMDDIALFSRALSGDEVARIASGERPLRTAPGKLPPFDYFPGVGRPASFDDPMIFTWGGYRNSSFGFLRAIGVNTVNVFWTEPFRARAVAEAGFCVNVRHENADDWSRFWGPQSDVEERIRARLHPYVSCKAWRSTLVNSEVYGMRPLTRASSNALYRAWAAEELGFTPDFRIKYPTRLDYKALGIKPLTGVIPEDFPAMKTIMWGMSDGQPAAKLNEITAAVVRKLSPGNLVWSEPSPSARGLDMTANWMYAYLTGENLFNFRKAAASARTQGVGYMPTLSGSYHCRWETPSGVHPTLAGRDGKPLKVNFAPTADETMIKCWLALFSEPISALSFWNDGTWEKGAENFAAFLKNPSTNVTGVAETGFTERFGSFMRRRFVPMLAKFKDVENVNSPIALIQADEMKYADPERWRYFKYGVLVGTALAHSPVGYDVLYNDEINEKTLSKYRYVILPIGNALLKKRYEALCAVSNTTTVVTDEYCSLDFPNAERIPMSFKELPPVNRYLKTVLPLKEWFDSHRDELRRAAFAWSDRDGIDAYTFVKRFPDGRRAVAVINDARSSRNPWSMFCKLDWYRPLGAENRITVHINLPGGGERVETHDFAPAEMKLFWVEAKETE